MKNLRSRFQISDLLFSALVFAGMALGNTASLSPNAITYGDQIVTTASAPAMVTMSNNTNKTLSVSGVTTSGVFQVQSNTCGNSVAAGAACGIGVVFVPISTGPATGDLSVLTDSQDGTLKIKLSGNGAPIQLISISLFPAGASVPLGTSQSFVATGSYNTGSTLDLTNIVAWSSSVTSVATISSAGFASSIAQGGTTISAGFGGLIGSATLAITPPVLTSLSVSPATASIPLGRSQQFTATGAYTDGTTRDMTGSVAWSTSLPSVATLTGSGFALSATQGSTMIKAAVGPVSGSAVLTVTPRALITILVSPASSSIPLGRQQQFNAIGTLTDGTTQDLSNSAVWTSSSLSVATVTGSGLALSFGQGSTTIGAAVGTVSGSAGLTVTPRVLISIFVSPASSSIPLGRLQPFNAIGMFTDGATQDLSNSAVWSSSSPSVAIVTQFGLSVSATQGVTTIKADSGGMSGSAVLTVTAPELLSLFLTPNNPSVQLGNTVQLTATGFYTSGSPQDLTSSVTWTSSVPGVAPITPTGLATTLALGGSLIRASSGSVTTTTVINVTPPALISVRITPVNPSIVFGPGGSQQFTATGATADGLVLDVTKYVTWSSSPLAVASVNLVGLATPSIGPGTATIKATIGAVSDSTTLTVTPPVLVSIQLNPLNAIFVLTQTPAVFGARGIYNNGSAVNLSASAVAWTSSNPTVATIDATGQSAFLAVGSTIITGVSGGVSAATTMTLVPQSFFRTGLMTTVRYSHTATLLSDGRVLLAGGRNSSNIVQRTLEIYDPVTQTFSASGFMNTVRQLHTATLLNNGKILVTGGAPFISHPPTAIATGTAELLDPSAGSFGSIGGMAHARLQHTATLLGNGKVLIAGGSIDGAIGVAPAELYDPATGLFTATGSMLVARFQHMATLLNDGRVFINGGTNDGFNAVGLAEIYDPATGVFSFYTNLVPRFRHSATLLASGQILVAGGVSTILQNMSPYMSADLLDVNGPFSVKTMLVAHEQHTGTLLADGRVLLAGGANWAAELYDPVTDQFKAIGNSIDVRIEHTSTRLANGDVLITGGSPDTTAELYRSPSGQ